MRILFDYRPALRQRTGVGEYVHELARALVGSAPAGESLTLFSSSWTDRLDADVIPGARQVDRRIPVRLLNFAWHRLSWPPAEAVAGGEFDVVQAAHPLLIPARRAARIVTVHDLDFLDHPDRTSAEIRRDYAALAGPHAQKADHVITVSRYTAGEVERRLDVDRSRISVCSPGRLDWPVRRAEPPSGCVLFLGTLEPRKNLDVLLDAYERLVLAAAPAASSEASVPPLVIAGRATPAAARLIERARRPPLAGHVTLAGYVDAEDRREWYEKALVFVLPSHTEGFGMPALEAMTVGVPVVAANRGALPEVVGPAGRLFEPHDAEALAGLLRAILSDAALRQRMREAGWLQAQRFSWSETARGVREAWAMATLRRRERRA